MVTFDLSGDSGSGRLHQRKENRVYPHPPESLKLARAAEREKEGQVRTGRGAGKITRTIRRASELSTLELGSAFKTD